MPLVVGYARVSSREQAIESQALEQQIARLEAAGATKIFKDIQSGSRDDRPELNELMDLVDIITILPVDMPEWAAETSNPLANKRLKMS